MTKQDFLNNKEVIAFIDYVAQHWHYGFDFRLSIFQKGRKSLIFHDIQSISDAYDLYFWGYSFSTKLRLPHYLGTKGHSFQESKAMLDYCTQLILNGFYHNSDASIREGAELVLKWGGVFKKGNKAFVENKNNNLKAYFENVRSVWEKLSNDGTLNEINQYDKSGLISNAGFTKIYSLFLPGFIIYDNRVSVALAYLLEQYFEDHIPEVLKLYIPPSQVVNNSKRRVHHFFDQSTYKANDKHFLSNVKASWLLSAISEKLGGTVKIREIEAALFMIGYDVRPTVMKQNKFMLVEA
jgi:hypothetical protein